MRPPPHQAKVDRFLAPGEEVLWRGERPGERWVGWGLFAAFSGVFIYVLSGHFGRVFDSEIMLVLGGIGGIGLIAWSTKFSRVSPVFVLTPQRLLVLFGGPFGFANEIPRKCVVGVRNLPQGPVLVTAEYTWPVPHPTGVSRASAISIPEDLVNETLVTRLQEWARPGK